MRKWGVGGRVWVQKGKRLRQHAECGPAPTQLVSTVNEQTLALWYLLYDTCSMILALWYLLYDACKKLWILAKNCEYLQKIVNTCKKYFPFAPVVRLVLVELQRGYLYQNGEEFRQKVIGAGLNMFWGHLNYLLGGIRTIPSLSVMWASAPIAIYIKMG